MNLPNEWAPGLEIWKHGRPETVCGRGSMMIYTENVRRILPEWIAKYEIKTLVDAGAGDLNWISTLKLPCEYMAFDRSPQHESIGQLDITKERLPACDAILCRHVLNHLGDDGIRSALFMFKNTAKYLILTTGTGPWKPPSQIGHFTDYDLRLPPFELGPPLETVEDCRGLLGIWKT